MRVQIVPEGSRPTSAAPMALRPTAAADYPTTYGPWRPRATIGATSIGGLLLPSAAPTASQVYAPRGVHVDASRVVVADTGNHRVLIHDGHPSEDGEDAAVVLGQPDATSEGPQAGGRGPAGGMNLPTGVLVSDGRLVVADAWNHRILVWDRVPTRHGVQPDLVLGQPDATSVDPNAGGGTTASVFYWPFGIAVVDGRFYVTDTGNRRVLVWTDGIPQGPDQPADVVIGQDDPTQRDENRGGAAGADSFRWPHAVCGDSRGGVLIADAGNHRALGWSAHPDTDCPADYVVGQPDMASSTEFPYQAQTGTVFRFPYALAMIGGPERPGLAVADTANNRVLLWDDFPHHHESHPDLVLGQASFSGNGENRWQMVDRDTLCWPYGIAGFEDRQRGTALLAVADSGNNRVVLWERS